jgi:WD40 repeat protein
MVVHRRGRDSVLDVRYGHCHRAFKAFTGTALCGLKRRPRESVLIIRGFAHGVPTTHLDRELDGRSAFEPDEVARTMRRIKVLFILANPDQTRPIDPDTEFREVWQAIRAAEHRDALELPTPLLAARWADVIEAVDNHKPDVIHISTHGGETELQFVGADGHSPAVVSIHLLRELFEPRKARVRLVLLNACSSAFLARELAAVLGCAIGMDRPITDPEATSFARIFYGRIAAGASVREAFERGCLALTGDGAKRDLILKARVKDAPALLNTIAHLFSAESRNPADLILVEPGPSDSLFHVPFPRNPFFVGRDDDLHHLHDLLTGGARDPVGIRPTGLTGMGGIGKTQLAVEYAYRFARDYPQGVYWVNAAPSVEAGLAELGTILGASVDASREVQIVAAFDALKALPNSLLVLDNLEDPAALSRPLAPARVLTRLPGHVLFTTRRTNIGDLAKFEIGVLAEPAALCLLLRHPSRHPIRGDSRNPEYLGALIVCRRLGWLPLALELGGAFLGRYPSVTLAQYRATLEKHGSLTVLDKGDDPRVADLSRVHKEAVNATLRSQWESLTQDDDRLILHIAGQLPGAASIPISRLALLAGISAEKEMDIFPSPLELAIVRLTDASLIEPLEHNDIRLHPLVHEFAAHQTPDAEVAPFRLACAARVASAYETYTVLEAQIRTRGIDAIQGDLLAALKLVPSADGDVRTRLQLVLRLVQREAHHLRGWDPAAQPALFAQAICYRATLLRLASLKEDSGSWLAGLSQPHALLHWRASRESPELVRTLTGHENWVNALAVLDADRVVSASDDRTLKVWDLDSGHPVQSLEGHGGRVNALAMLDGRRVVSASDDRTLKVWDLDRRQAVMTLEGHGGRVYAVVVLDEQRLVSGSYDRTLKVWDLDRGQAVMTLEGHGGWVAALVAVHGRYLVSSSDDCTLKVWDLDSGHPVQSLEGHRDWVKALAVLDERRVISASDDGTLKVWDLDGGHALLTLKGHGGGERAVAVLDEHRLVSAPDDGTLKVWNLNSGRVVMTMVGHGNWVNAVVALNEHRVVSGSYDHTLRVWDLDSGETVLTLRGHGGRVIAVAVLDERRVVSASDDRTLKVWDLDSGRALQSLEGHSGRVSSVTALDERRIVSASYDGTLKVWDLDSGRAVTTMAGHGGRVNAVAVLDSRRVLSGSDDQTLKVWDLETGGCLATVPLDGIVTSLTVTSDGATILTGDRAGTIYALRLVLAS